MGHGSPVWTLGRSHGLGAPGHSRSAPHSVELGSCYPTVRQDVEAMGDVPTARRQ